jgi:hypothetical protein
MALIIIYMGFIDKNKIIRLSGDNDRGRWEMKIPP